MKSRRFFTAILLVALAIGPTRVWAQAEQAEPAPGVARVSLIHGGVTTERGDSSDRVAAGLNSPVVRGDRVTTGDRSRTEVELDYANILRLDQRSEVKVADLTRTRIQLQLAQGTMTFTVLKGSEADVEIDTPNMAVRPIGAGTYRIQVNTPEETEVVVRDDGQAEITVPQGSTLVNNNERIVVQGSSSPQYQTSKAPPRDDWDQWNRDRDSVIRNARNNDRYVNRYYAGSQDLDRYGRWTDVPGYGWSWTPYGPAGWVPYRDGRWVWEPYWGWTWVSYDPWGWAPYHYGRWFLYGSSWYWWPGFVTSTFVPVFAPAWVSFIGFGFGHHHFHFGFGFGFSSIGWLPLAPFDPFFPWWGFHNSFNVVNITNITNIRNVTNVTNVTNIRNLPVSSNFQGAFRNPRIRGAITTVSAEDFANGRVPRRVERVDVNALRQGQVVQGTLPVVPTRKSLEPAGRTAAPAVARANAARQNFFTRNAPPAGPQSFSERASEIRQMVETHNALRDSNRGGAAFQTSANSPEAGQASRSQRSFEGNSGWRMFGRPGTSKNTGVPTPVVPRVSENSPTASFTTQNDPAARITQSTDRPRPLTGWQRFASAGSNAVSGGQTDENNGRSARETRREVTPQPAPATNSREPARPGWKRFGSADSRRTAAPPREAPRATPPQPAPPARSESPSRSGDWRQFTPRSERNEGWSAPAPRERTDFPSRSENPGYSRARSPDQRPPLEIRKPIVVERAPRSRGGADRGTWGSRSERGGNSGNRGGGRNDKH